MALQVGKRLNLHRGAQCRLSAPNEAWDGCQCSIVAYSAPRGKWFVQLHSDDGSEWNDQRKLVNEKALTLRYAVLPITKREMYVDMKSVNEADDQGRGLVVNQVVKAGQVLFADSPILVFSTSNKNKDEAGHYDERFLAYTILGGMAGQEGNEAAHEAFTMFENLGPAGIVPQQLRKAALAIRDVNATDEWTAEMREGTLAVVTDVLMKFEMNQFGFDSGDPSVGSSAVYPFTARLNHSCDPSAQIITKRDLCTEANEDFKPEEHGDVIVAVARNNLEPGDRLTINYPFGALGFPKEMDVRQRRALLLRKGFSCGCERCVTEELTMAAADESPVAPSDRMELLAAQLAGVGVDVVEDAR